MHKYALVKESRLGKRCYRLSKNSSNLLEFMKIDLSVKVAYW